MTLEWIGSNNRVRCRRQEAVTRCGLGTGFDLVPRSSSSGSRGGIVLPMITKGLRSINLVENSSGMCGLMLLLLGCGPRGFYPFCSGFRMRVSARLRGVPAVVRLRPLMFVMPS
jgi:hypothetical protein